MLCPYCFEIAEPAPSIFDEGACSVPHCIRSVCCIECPECGDWFLAIEPEEGKVIHPKAKLAPEESSKGKVRNSPCGGGATKPPGPPIKAPEGDIPW